MLATVLATVVPAIDSVAQDGGGAVIDETAVVGSTVETTNADSETTVEDVLAALKVAGSTAERLNMIFGVDGFVIVRLRPEDMERLEPALDERQDAIADLREAVSSSALFYNALRASNINASSVIAVHIDKQDASTVSRDEVIVYVYDRR